MQRFHPTLPVGPQVHTSITRRPQLSEFESVRSRWGLDFVRQMLAIHDIFVAAASVAAAIEVMTHNVLHVDPAGPAAVPPRRQPELHYSVAERRHR